MFELIYNDSQTRIIGVKELELSTLRAYVDPETGDRVWIQYENDPERRRALLDGQVVSLVA
jgi:hypothetical protein